LKEIPFGSSYFMAILGKKLVSFFIQQYEKKNMSSVLFIHNWQIDQPKNVEFPTRLYLLKNPTYIPYRWNIRNVIEYLFKNFQFTAISNFDEKA